MSAPRPAAHERPYVVLECDRIVTFRELAKAARERAVKFRVKAGEAGARTARTYEAHARALDEVAASLEGAYHAQRVFIEDGSPDPLKLREPS